MRYRPLKATRKEIRLVQLVPGAPVLPGLERIMPLECTLEHFAFDQCPEYRALSYAWGHEDRSMPIIVDGNSVLVTTNLLYALLQFRSKDIRSWLWIDMICIDQSNDVEKSEQVQRMRSIYQNAKEVTAWLGPNNLTMANNETMLTKLKGAKDRIVEKFTCAYDRVQIRCSQAYEPPLTIDSTMPYPASLKLQRQCGMDTDKRFGSERLLHIDLDRFSEVLSSDAVLAEELVYEVIPQKHTSGRENAESLNRLLSKEIWRRIWVIQEFASGQEIVLLYGTESMLLRDFFVVWLVLYYHINHSQVVDSLSPGEWPMMDTNIKSIAPLLLQSKVWQNGQKPRCLFELLRATGGFNASDNRDKVFALLGIAEDAQELELHPDYSKSYREVGVDVTKALVRKYGLSMLSFNAGLSCRMYALHGSHPEQLPKDQFLPSWCCDWTFRSHHTIAAGHPKGYLDFSAGDACNDRDTSTFSVDESLDTLSIKAIRLGSVTAVRSLPHWVGGGNPISLTSQVFSELEGLVSTSKAQGLVTTMPELEDVFFCTPIAYNGRKGQMTDPGLVQVPKDLSEAYRTLRSSEVDLGGDDCAAKVRPYVQEVNRIAAGRALFACTSHHLGLGPWNAREGDVLCIFLGTSVPYVIRPLSSGTYHLVGEAYVHGIMYGEFVKNLDRVTLEVITLE
ncbi:hypothetical protein CLAIMM_11361 [Cladophialophora immunda]|nr:hypothetical protein CLAIMM_11361 [Cladophialophora immunda]